MPGLAKGLTGATLWMLALGAACVQPAAAAGGCDRSCLEGFGERYLAALLAHDPTRLPLAQGVQYVENDQALPLGAGAWKTIDGLGAYRHYFADPEMGQLALISTVRENGADALFTLRLKIVSGRIAEIEAIVTHDPRGAQNYAKLGKPEAAWLESVPAQRRVTREQLAFAANSYLTGMQNNDGEGDYSFFADDCNRLEHGLKTTNGAPQNYGHSQDSDFITMSCRAQFETGFLGFVTRIRDRRYIVDVERQAVFAIATLDHDGTVRSIDMTTGRIFRIPAYFSTSRTLQVGEGFHIENGKIHDIEMTLHEFPYGTRQLFPETQLAPESLAAECNRACLEGIASEFLAALRSHEPQRAPLSLNVRYTQNAQSMHLGDGLWGTVTHIGPYEVRVADPQSASIVVVARVTEIDIPGVLSARLKTDHRKISDIDLHVAHEEKPGQDTLFRPHLLVETDPLDLGVADANQAAMLPTARRSGAAELTSIVNRYFDALEGRGGAVAFAPECVRHDNGVQVTHNTAMPEAMATPDPALPHFHPYAMGCEEQLRSGFFGYITRVRDRSTPVVDVERGLVFVTAYLDIPGTVRALDVAGVGKVTLPATLARPYTLLGSYVFRIEEGRIRRIDSFSSAGPYGLHPAQ
jgi:hypothetical protein